MQCYHDHIASLLSTQDKRSCKRERLEHSNYHPNLVTLSLNRGGLSQVDLSTFDFFCFLEVSISPFLNLASFRSSSKNSVPQLCSAHGSPLALCVQFSPLRERVNFLLCKVEVCENTENVCLLQLYIFTYRLSKMVPLCLYKCQP